MKKHEHRYRYGKQTGLIGFQEFKNLVEKARLSSEKAAFIWMLYFTGARKSEIYELTAKDCQLTETHFIVDIHRKKHGTRVDPLSSGKLVSERMESKDIFAEHVGIGFLSLEIMLL